MAATPRGLFNCGIFPPRGSAKTMHFIAATILVIIVNAVQASPHTNPSAPFRVYGPPVLLSHSPRVYPAIASPGPAYLANAGAVKRNARIIYPDGLRAAVTRTDLLQAIDEHLYPWSLRGSSQGYISSQAATEAALSRTLFFGDIPHERALGSYISFRRGQGLPDIRLGSIRFSSPFLLAF